MPAMKLSLLLLTLVYTSVLSHDVSAPNDSRNRRDVRYESEFEVQAPDVAPKFFPSGGIFAAKKAALLGKAALVGKGVLATKVALGAKALALKKKLLAAKVLFGAKVAGIGAKFVLLPKIKAAAKLKLIKAKLAKKAAVAAAAKAAAAAAASKAVLAAALLKKKKALLLKKGIALKALKLKAALIGKKALIAKKAFLLKSFVKRDVSDEADNLDPDVDDDVEIKPTPVCPTETVTKIVPAYTVIGDSYTDYPYHNFYKGKPIVAEHDTDSVDSHIHAQKRHSLSSVEIEESANAIEDEDDIDDEEDDDDDDDEELPYPTSHTDCEENLSRELVIKDGEVHYLTLLNVTNHGARSIFCNLSVTFPQGDSAHIFCPALYLHKDDEIYIDNYPIPVGSSEQSSVPVQARAPFEITFKSTDPKSLFVCFVAHLPDPKAFGLDDDNLDEFSKEATETIDTLADTTYVSGLPVSDGKVDVPNY